VFAPAAGTIVAKSRLAHARVLAESFRRHHPDVPFFVCLADEVDGCFDPGSEPYRLLSWTELHIPDPVERRFRHAREPFSYALTAAFLRHLVERGHGPVLFLKQESLVVGSLEPVFRRLEESSIVLTPHLLEPLDGKPGAERELEILRAGTFNVGLLGVSAAPEAREFLGWWDERIARHCRRAVGEGIHFEQRWVDLVPALFPGAHVLRDPGANVGHWNLPERRVERSSGEFTTGGGPVRLFRFSGFDPAEPGWPTCHSRRIRTEELGGAAAAFARYAELLAAAGDAEASLWPWAYGSFDNGVPVPEVARDVHREMGPEARRFGDPLHAAGAESYWAWLHAPAPAPGAGPHGLTRFWLEVYRRRPDVQQAFPDAFGSESGRFRDWISRYGAVEYAVSEAFLPEAP